MLTTPLSKAIRTTSTHIKRLKELGIETVEDFLLNFPHRYTDERMVTPIAEIQVGEPATVRGRVASIVSRSVFRKRMKIITALVTDASGSVQVVWFNRGFLAQQLTQGSEIVLAGKPRFDTRKGIIMFNSPEVELVKEEQIHTARIVPVYHQTELSPDKKAGGRTGKISSKWLREKLHPLLSAADELEEFLPEKMRTQYKLIGYSDAIKSAHFPKDEGTLDVAKRRLAFNELFLLQLAALSRRAQWRAAAHNAKRPPLTADWELIKRFSQSLPWPLTNAQKKAIFEIISDLEKPYPMSRLLEGDTGSGKTVVAAAAILHTITAGLQVALLAPTEILARQHAKTLMQVLKPFGITPALLVGATPAAEKRAVINGLATGTLSLVVGTHALLREDIRFKNLGLAVVDEQHRFGVRQREALKDHGSPHLLAMSATPIPRTLALVLYGDQDLSILDEMPAGRQTIMTRIVPEEKRTQSYTWIESQIGEGRQAFIIFPLIEESENLQIKAATSEFERLSEEVFPHLKMGLLHGQLKPTEKDVIMQQFAEGTIQILVSTAVVEVGVDVPNATIMMIEGAERFGLAQLHQFRGRVGRGVHQSYCLLFPSIHSPVVLKRLHALVEHSSGFKLAEIDLQIRGPGEVFGTAQSGIPDLRMATLSDVKTIAEAREAALALLEEDSSLAHYPLLQQKISEQENIAIDY